MNESWSICLLSYQHCQIQVLGIRNWDLWPIENLLKQTKEDGNCADGSVMSVVNTDWGTHLGQRVGYLRIRIPNEKERLVVVGSWSTFPSNHRFSLRRRDCYVNAKGGKGAARLQWTRKLQCTSYKYWIASWIQWRSSVPRKQIAKES